MELVRETKNSFKVILGTSSASSVTTQPQHIGKSVGTPKFMQTVIEKLFSYKTIPKLAIAGGIKLFVKSWKNVK